MKIENRIIKHVGLFIGTYIVLTILFLTTLVLSSLIPSSSLKQHINESVDALRKEGIYPTVGLQWRRIVLDNFTDTLMLNTAFSVNSSEPIKSSLTTIRYEGNTDNINQISNLEKYIHEKKDIHPVSYERYWHGYLIYLRPLLTTFSYSSIRIVMTLALYISFFIFLYLSWKKLGKKISIIFLLGFICVDFFYLGQSLQFSPVFLIGLLGSIYLLLKSQRMQNFYVVFFIIGGLTSFFDLLTAPLVTLGMLLIVATSLEMKDMKTIILQSIMWSIGYLLLWYTKWFIVQTLFVPHAVAIAVDQILNRTVTQADANFSQINAIKLNLFQLIGYDKINKIFLLCIAIISFIFSFKYITFKIVNLKNIMLWTTIGIIPYFWYVIAANHSYLHVWFTYRDQFMSVVCGLLIATECIDWTHVNRDITELRSTNFSNKLTSKNH